MPILIKRRTPDLPDGDHSAHFVSIEIVEGKYGQRAMWTVELAKDGSVYKATGWTDPDIEEGTPAHRWASAIAGHVLAANEVFENEKLEGSPVIVTLKAQPARNGSKTFYSILDLKIPPSGEAFEPDEPKPDQPEDDVPF